MVDQSRAAARIRPISRRRRPGDDLPLTGRVVSPILEQWGTPHLWCPPCPPVPPAPLGEAIRPQEAAQERFSLPGQPCSSTAAAGRAVRRPQAAKPPPPSERPTGPPSPARHGAPNRAGRGAQERPTWMAAPRPLRAGQSCNHGLLARAAPNPRGRQPSPARPATGPAANPARRSASPP